MDEAQRQRAIRRKLVASELRAPVCLATGFVSLDEATGGLPRGRIVELFGAAGTGKTTLALQMVAQTQRQNGGAAWIDAEHSFDPAYAAGLGVAVDGLAVAQPQSAEQAFEIIRRLSVSGAVDLFIVDSAAALVPEVELRTGIGKSGPGAHSRSLASGLRKLTAALRTSGAVVVFLNQTRAREDLETSAGGAPLKLFSAIRISLHRASPGRVRFRVLKNKAVEPFREGHLRWEKGRGFTERP
jgi:recombination protein RecA